MKDMILYQKVYDFMLYLFPVVDRYPKYEKFALQTQIKNSVLRMVRFTIDIQKSSNKKRYLYEIDKELEYLKVLLMFSNEKKPAYLSANSRETSMKKIAEIGRIVGGLIKKFGV